MIKNIKGMRDILPPDSYLWNVVEDIAIKTFTGYGYLEIRTPVLEYLDLFQRSIGENTDIVNKEMYVFKDKKGRDLALRPEGTAPVARSYISTELKEKPQPLRLFYMGQMFRYERPQKGRFRQFYQIGLELLGLENPQADGEVLEVLINFLKNLMFCDLNVSINSVGCEKCRIEYIKKLKISLEEKKMICVKIARKELKKIL